MEEDNVNGFIRVTAKTIPIVKKHMKDAEDHLLTMTQDQIQELGLSEEAGIA
jgi:hypothetical protein